MTCLQFSAPTNGTDEQRQLFESFRACRFDGLQLKAGQYQRYLHDHSRFIDDWGADAAAVSGLICGGALDPYGVESLRQIIAFGAAVGSKRIIFCHAHSREGLTRGDLAGFASTLSELARDAQQSGLSLSLHHHYDHPVMTWDDLRWFFNSAADGTIGLTVDTAHLQKSGEHDIAGILREFWHVIDNIHLKDFAGGAFVPLCHGEINFVPIIHALREGCYVGPLCADEESGVGVLDGMQMAQKCLAELKGVYAEKSR